MHSAAFSFGPAPAAGAAAGFALGGQVTLADGAALWATLLRALPAHGEAEVDLSAVDRLDGGAAALLQAIVRQRAATGAVVHLRGARGEAARLLQLYACRDAVGCDRPAPVQPGLLAEVGNFTVGAVGTTRAILAFTGDLVHGALQAVRRPRSLHFGDFGRLVEQGGMNGVPIVGLVNLLVGLVMGLQGAIQLHRFGGDTFLANFVGISAVRELGPLMTAILVTGRSGAGYAAELGTMTVNEEVDALRTLGQDPQRYLVFPRVLALLLAVPVLTLLASFCSIVGGLIVAVTYLEQPATVYLQGLQRAVQFTDVGTGLLKSAAFAVVIGLVACQRGLSTRGGAAGVGNATTSAVVVSLFSLVVVDSVFVRVFSKLGW